MVPWHRQGSGTRVVWVKGELIIVILKNKTYFFMSLKLLKLLKLPRLNRLFNFEWP